ncbi:hypothetical protein DDR33_11575 [Pararcticibacter amylolyticus]|uniref:Uncharacterized protein n=1 Tax=Pararcticibacter amylolyticus TaxID=2173175 RepID=A0A2U2PGW1_9SPHI|nr:hypothetical protein DDR33_11575 [Pararcticibacter amylolyticus]
MKSPAIILLFILLYTSGYSQRPSVEEALKNMANVQMPHIQTSPDMTKYEGKDIYVCDTITDYKIINDSLKLFYLGNQSGKYNMTIVIKSSTIKVYPGWKGHRQCFKGLVTRYEGKPAIIITQSGQIGVFVEI